MALSLGERGAGTRPRATARLTRFVGRKQRDREGTLSRLTEVCGEEIAQGAAG